MRSLLAIAVLFVVTTAGTRLLAQDEFPYTATIKRDGATVHSGPAKVHYMTCRLKAGDAVEVYRHDPNGWLAIRPVENDFSLVRAKYVLANFSKGIGQITRDGIHAWVGTESTDENDPLWQIQFRKGDRVRLKGKQQIEDSSGELHSWYEIAPPAGEFRWVHESAFKDAVKPKQIAVEPISEIIAASTGDTVQSIEEGGISQIEIPVEETPTSSEPNWQQVVATENDQDAPREQEPESVQTVSASEPVAPKPFQPEKLEVSQNGSIFPKQNRQEIQPTTQSPPSATTNEGRQADWQVASESSTFNEHSSPIAQTAGGITTDSSAGPDASSAPNGREPNRLGQFESQQATVHGDANQQRQSLTAQPGPAFEDQLRALEIALTQEVVAPADRWQLEAFQDATLQLSRTAKSTQQRQEINRLLEKLKSFNDLQQRHLSINRVGYESSVPVKSTAEESRRSVAPAILETTTNNLLADNSANQQQMTPDSLNANPAGAGAATANTDYASRDQSPDGEVSIYDAEGWLSHLYTGNGRGQTAYAVQDASGNILKTILPAPGVNLDRYLDKEVGIMGRSGFNRKYNKPHVTADRVIVLDRHR